MNFRTKIWMLPISAAAVFVVGVAVSFAVGERTSGILQHLHEVDNPHMAHVQTVDRSVEQLRLTLQTAAAEGEADKLKETDAMVATAKKALADMDKLPEKSAIAKTLGDAFEAYQSSAIGATRALLTQQPPGDQLGKMQSSLQSLDKLLNEHKASAKAAIDEIQRRRDRAEATRHARTHPAAIALLDAFFKRQGWDDPAGHLRDAIAGYPLAAVITAIATWDARAMDERLPGTADARYLLGIARNVSDEREARAFADALWKRRLAAKDAILVDLQRQRDALAGDDTQRLRAAVQRAIDAESAIERAVWRDAAGDLLRCAGPNQRQPLWITATSLIATAYRIPKKRRSELIADLAEHVIPLTAE